MNRNELAPHALLYDNPFSVLVSEVRFAYAVFWQQTNFDPDTVYLGRNERRVLEQSPYLVHFLEADVLLAHTNALFLGLTVVAVDEESYRGVGVSTERLIRRSGR